jgi:uncharacterized protein (DUF4415 family)
MSKHPPIPADGAPFDDLDNPEWTAETFARAQAERDQLPPEVQALIKRPPGRPPAASPKVAIKLRLDAAVVAYFKGTGPGWQTRINDALAIQARQGLRRKPR